MNAAARCQVLVFSVRHTGTFSLHSGPAETASCLSVDMSIDIVDLQCKKQGTMKKNVHFPFCCGMKHCDEALDKGIGQGQCRCKGGRASLSIDESRCVIPSIHVSHRHALKQVDWTPNGRIAWGE
jgi:hypothetical protein